MNEDSGGGEGAGAGRGGEAGKQSSRNRGRGGRSRGRGGRGQWPMKQNPKYQDNGNNVATGLNLSHQTQESGSAIGATLENRHCRGKRDRNHGRNRGIKFDNHSRHHMSNLEYNPSSYSTGPEYNGNYYGQQHGFSSQDSRLVPSEYQEHFYQNHPYQDFYGGDGHTSNYYSDSRSSYKYGQGNGSCAGRGGRDRGNFSRDKNRNESKQKRFEVSLEENLQNDDIRTLKESEKLRKFNPNAHKSFKKLRKRPGKERINDKESNLRERLTESLMRGTSECMVCLDKVKQQQATWDCRNCFQVFHITCIKKWAKSVTVEGSWRCPGCQTPVTRIPREYRCFCGKLINPDWNKNEGLVPHTCGEICARPLASASGLLSCPHTCSDLCHPGES